MHAGEGGGADGEVLRVGLGVERLKERDEFVHDERALPRKYDFVVLRLDALPAFSLRRLPGSNLGGGRVDNPSAGIKAKGLTLTICMEIGGHDYEAHAVQFDECGAGW